MSNNISRRMEFGLDGQSVIMNGGNNGVGVMPSTTTLDADTDFEPQPRDRCNTWPLQRTNDELGHTTSPLIHEEIPEEGEEEDESLSGSNENFEQLLPPHQQHQLPPIHHHHLSPNHQQAHNSSPNSVSPNSNGTGSGGPKKNSARRNAWGNLSYADLITQAIMSSPEKRLTLSQIYDWMVQNVPYFRDKGDSNSSAGWKNSIRHNLSLHSRFVRIQNEGAGKSSWWVINPDAKPGKSSRRRTSTMPSGQDAMKASLEKKRRGVKKKIEQQRAALAAALGQTAGGLNGNEDSNTAAALLNDLVSDGSYHNLSPGDFRNRSDSNLSTYSSVGRSLSPTYEDLEFLDWESMTGGAVTNSDSQRDLFNPTTTANVDSGNDLATSMNLSMNLAADPLPTQFSTTATNPNNSVSTNGGGAWRKPQQPRSGVSVSSSPLVHHQTSPIKGSPSTSARINGTSGYSPIGGTTIKSEPPSYQELYPSASGGGNSVQLQLRNTLLIKKETAAAMGAHHSYGAPTGNSDSFNNYYQLQQPIYQQIPPQQQQFMMNTAAPQQFLPTELSDIQYDSTFKNDIQCDIDQVIRHELSVAGKLDFNLTDQFANL